MRCSAPPMGRGALLSVLLALAGMLARLRRRVSSALSARVAARRVAYDWESCHDCRVALPDRVCRLMDRSYCQSCHEEREAALD